LVAAHECFELGDALVALAQLRGTIGLRRRTAGEDLGGWRGAGWSVRE
jgi:hypothetical protein